MKLSMSGSTTGKALRLSRLFQRDGRTVVFTIDHGKVAGAMKGMEDAEATLAWAMASHTDAVLLNLGVFKRTVHLWQRFPSPGVVLALDVHLTASLPGGGGGDRQAYRMLSTVNEAAALGADAVKIVLAFGRRDLEIHAENLRLAAEVVREAEIVGMPVIFEPTLWGDGIPDERKNDASLIPHICRIAVELGADAIKTPYAEGVFRELCRQLPVPVTVMGGAKTETMDDLFSWTRQIVDEGVAGLIVGRNVWQHEDPVTVWRELNRIFHPELGLG
jgi:DhnA family fructose-bisphosphate aldolase class Ia